MRSEDVSGPSRFRTTLGRSASSDSGDRGSGGARGRSNSFSSRSVSVRVDRPRTRTKSALLPRFGREELAAYPAGSSCFYCRKTSGWGGGGGTIRWFADAVPPLTAPLRSAVVVAALENAVEQRRPADVIDHSDQACQLTLNRSSQHRTERGC